MSEQDELLSRLRRVVRHDLRNPLTIILGRCELLESELQGPLTEAQQGSVRAITRNAERLLAELDELAALMEALRDR